MEINLQDSLVPIRYAKKIAQQKQQNASQKNNQAEPSAVYEPSAEARLIDNFLRSEFSNTKDGILSVNGEPTRAELFRISHQRAQQRNQLFLLFVSEVSRRRCIDTSPRGLRDLSREFNERVQSAFLERDSMMPVRRAATSPACRC